MHTRSWSTLAALLVPLISTSARADSSWPGQENTLDDRLVDGDIDEEDRTIIHLGGGPNTAQEHGQSWLSLVGFANQLVSGQNDVGGMVLVGLAFDRLAAGPLRRMAEPDGTESRPSATPTGTRSAPAPQTTLTDEGSAVSRLPVLVAASLARACVAAALRTSGLGLNDASIDALVARARTSAWLPETRMRAMRLIADSERATTLATTDGTNYYQTVGAHLVLELRLTWRFDRLLYAGDEPTLERARLERQQARSRLAARTLDVLFSWQRAVVTAQTALIGSNDELQARLRASEAQATLDVLTDGWFSHRGE